MAHHRLPVTRHPGVTASFPAPVARVPGITGALGGNHFHALRGWRLLDDDVGLGKGRGTDERSEGQRDQHGITQMGQGSHGNSFIGVQEYTLLMG